MDNMKRRDYMSYEYEIASLMIKIDAKEEEIQRLNTFIRQIREIGSHGNAIGLSQLKIEESVWRDITTNRSRSLQSHFNDVKSGIGSKIDRMCQKAEEKKERIQSRIEQLEADIKMYRKKALKGGS